MGYEYESVLRLCRKKGEMIIYAQLLHMSPKERLKYLKTLLEQACRVPLSEAHSDVNYDEVVKEREAADARLASLLDLLFAAGNDVQMLPRMRILQNDHCDFLPNGRENRYDESQESVRTQAQYAHDLACALVDSKITSKDREDYPKTWAILFEKVIDYWGRWSSDKEADTWLRRWLNLAAHTGYSKAHQEAIIKQIIQTRTNWRRERLEEAFIAMRDNHGYWKELTDSLRYCWSQKLTIGGIVELIGKDALISA